MTVAEGIKTYQERCCLTFCATSLTVTYNTLACLCQWFNTLLNCPSLVNANLQHIL